jgi:hypothetical protein
VGITLPGTVAAASSSTPRTVSPSNSAAAEFEVPKSMPIPTFTPIRVSNVSVKIQSVQIRAARV